MSDANLRPVTLPDGRVIYTRADRDGALSLDLPVPGALGEVLSPIYRARLVVERADGGALTEADRAHVGDALESVARHDALTGATEYARGEMFNRRCERSDAAEAAEAPPAQGARSAA
jgi:hypothetical protein